MDTNERATERQVEYIQTLIRTYRQEANNNQPYEWFLATQQALHPIPSRREIGREAQRELFAKRDVDYEQDVINWLGKFNADLDEMELRIAQLMTKSEASELIDYLKKGNFVTKSRA